MKKTKIAIIVSITMSLDKLYPDFFSLLQKKKYDIVGIASEDRFVENIQKQGIRFIPLPIKRDFSIYNDLVCLFKLIKILKEEKFDIIHYSTPKASFLAAIAGKLIGQKNMLYTLRGLGYESYIGIKKVIAKLCEKIACRSAYKVIAISESLKEHAIKENLVNKSKIVVLGAGSSKGVDIEKFSLKENVLINSRNIRKSLNIKESDIVFGYIGRFTPEKGIHEFFEAFQNLRKKYSNIQMLLVGDQDERRALSMDLYNKIITNSNVHHINFKDNIEDYIAALDVLVFPTYREGFGNVLIETSAMERPVIASDIIGCRDALIPEKTGLLIQPKNVHSLQSAMEKMINNPDLRIRMGKCGRSWVCENFDRKYVWLALLNVYESLIQK